MKFLVTTALLASAAFSQADTNARSSRAFEAEIKLLGSDKFVVRQEATRKLWEAGTAAEAALRRALRHRSPEVRARAASILDDFKFGIFPDTPQTVVRLIRRYRASSPVLKRTIWGQLSQSATVATLLALTEEERDPSLKGSQRKQILDRLVKESETELALEMAEEWRLDEETPGRFRREYETFLVERVPSLLATRRFEEAERILAASVDEYEWRRSEDFDRRVRDWAVYLQLRNGVDEQIADLRQHLDEKSDDQKRLNQLARLLQVKGDLTAARDVARQISDTTAERLRAVLFEMGAWDELIPLYQQRLETRGGHIEDHSFLTAFYRLAGKPKEYRDEIQTILDMSERSHKGDRKYCREALMLNGRTSDAIDSLERDDPSEAFDLLVLQERYLEAFSLAGGGRDRESREKWFAAVLRDLSKGSVDSEKRFDLSISLARSLRRVGLTDEGQSMIKRLGDSLPPDYNLERVEQLARAELQFGLTDRAFETALKLIDGAGREAGSTAIKVLFSRWSSIAQTWWEHHRIRHQAANEDRPFVETNQERLTFLRELFYGESYATELEAAATYLEERASELDPAVRANWLYAIGETWRLHGNVDNAVSFYERSVAAGGNGAIEIADRHRIAEQWREAADWYRRAWEHNREHIYTLYLHGQMLVRAGEEELGRQQIELARLAPLATKARHHELASPLHRRGYRDEALREWELMIRAGSWTEAEMFYATAAVGEAFEDSAPARAATQLEQRMLNCLQTRWLFTDLASYIRIPYQVHQLRARALLETDDLDGAARELRYCRDIWPGNSTLAEKFVPLLEAKGRQADADALFVPTYDLLKAACDAFPTSAYHRNNIAWMSSRCDRKLDEALAYALRANELSPDNAQYLDTLGEVHFRRGEFDQAIAIAQRCIELDPDTEFYGEQLARFRDAASNAP